MIETSLTPTVPPRRTDVDGKRSAARPAIYTMPVVSWSIDHISAVTLPVTDMGRSVAFYQRLGLDVSYGGPEALFTTMRAGDGVINLRRVPFSASRGWGRVILRVRGVDALHERLLEKGLAPTAPSDADWGERYFEISDPDGFVISFAQPL